MFEVNVIRYFRIFRRYIGKRVYVVSALTLLAAATEGVGIALLLPLLGLLGLQGPGAGSAAQGGGSSLLESLVRDTVAMVGIEGSMPGILVFIGFVFTLKGLLKFGEGAYRSHLQSELLQEVQRRLFNAYSTMEYGYYSRHNTGHFSNLITVQVPKLVTSYERYNKFLGALITVTAYFIFAFLISWPFATMATAAGVTMVLVFRRLTERVRHWSRHGAVEHGTLNHFLVQTLQAFKYLAATAQVHRLKEEVLKSVARVAAFQRRKEIAWSFTESLQEPLAIAVLVMLIVVQVRVFNEPLAPVLVGLVLLYRAMGQLVLVQAQWQAMMQEVGSLEIVEAEFAGVSASQQPNGSTALAPLARGITLERVSFAYDDAPDTPALDDITLTIPANRTIAIVGESGSGKTTLADILTLVLRPRGGVLRIDGVRDADIDVTSWRSQIGYVSQDTIVFDDTVANNICMWSGDYASDQQVRRNVARAAACAGAKAFIDALPDGFETRVGDRGVRLSGGQRQRLFIAREIYKNPHLLILDEATSALDSESELIVKEAVDQLKGSTTVVIIAHRLSTIREADYIYVLDGGRIREQGTYQELALSRGGTFNRMVALQQL